MNGGRRERGEEEEGTWRGGQHAAWGLLSGAAAAGVTGAILF